MDLGLAVALINVLGVVIVAVVGVLNGHAIHKVHIDLNSRLSQLIELSRSEGHAAGIMEQRDKRDAVTVGDSGNMPAGDTNTGS